MKITRLRTRRFRGFHANFALDLPGGQNVLLYGDNGSGKSSIACALKNILVDQASPITPHRNVFSAQGEDAEIEITYNPWPDPLATTLRWDQNGHPLDQLAEAIRPTFRNAVARASFIDYRDLLRTSGSKDSLPHEFFDLTAGTLLRFVEATGAGGTSTTLGALYDSTKWFGVGLRKRERVDAANARAASFNGAFQAFLGPLESKVSELLGHFEGLLTTVRFDYEPLRWDDENWSKCGGKLRPIVTFKGTELDHGPAILNEARLTALAICIFLAGAIISDVDPANPNHPRLLVLDDALISLDASNRKPVLEILQLPAFQYFQIIMLTHDSVWFDVARKRLNGWKVCKLLTEHPERPDEASVPVFQEIGTGGPASDLDIAENHLNQGDKPAAAVYARSAFEQKLKLMAEKNHLQLSFQREVKRVSADSLWTAVKNWNAGLVSPHIPASIVTAIEAFRSDILNELSHSEPRNWDIPTIRTAITTLRQFCALPNKP